MTKHKELQPLQDLLDSVLARLDVLEGKAGVIPPPARSSVAASTAAVPPPPMSPVSAVPDSHAEVKAYDAFLEKSVAPLKASCDALGGMKNMGQLIQDSWTSIRTVIAIACRAKMPSDPTSEVQPLLGDVQSALQQIRQLRLDRQYDDHCKAILEMSTALSWILIRPPPQTPVAFVKEAAGSTDFWANRIRKQYKGKDESQIAFCNALKQVLVDLQSYISEYHKTGLTWNPRGVSLAEAAIVVKDEETSSPAAATAAPHRAPPSPRRASVSGGSGGMASLVSELASKRTADGSSAATGLKHVTREQQTWRKEFKGDKKTTVPLETPAPKKEVAHKKKLAGIPICEYQERGHKWVVEHQTKEATQGKVLTVEVTDPKQQVYMFNCDHVTVQIKGGKCKSVIMDRCQYSNVLFESVISACEIVHCKKCELQTTGVCPSFSIDQTEGCTIYLSKESVDVTNFVTSQSTEMNVSFPDGDEQKEVPIPEQFVHKLVDGAVTSEVSDVYH